MKNFLILFFFRKTQEENTDPIEINDIETDQKQIEEPCGNEKIMIDKLAEYVFRNGLEFEENLRQKNDSRFEFLNSDHKFNNYYKIQLESFLKKVIKLNIILI